MKRALLIASAAIVLAANGLALLHALRNRTGTTDAELTLTQRELQYFNRFAADSDSGVTLHLNWTDPSSFSWPAEAEKPAIWLDKQQLQKLGFACGVNADSPDAGHYYQRQRPRRVFVALEFDGAAWRVWVEAYERAVAEQRVKRQLRDSTGSSYRSHLVAIDADLDPLKLRARYPDRTTVIVVPAVVAVTVEPFPYSGMKLDPKRSPQVIGRIQQLPSSIHVPLPFSEEFRRLNQPRGDARNKDPLYRVHLRYGASFEPWITGVEFMKRP